MKASLVLTLQGNVVQQARQFAEGFRALSTNGRTQMALLSRGVKSFSDGLDALGNKYTGMLTGAAGAAALRSAGGMESRLERLGIVADRSKKEMQRLNDEIFKVSQDRKINVDSSEVLSAIEQITAKTGDMAVAEENLKNIAMVLSATGASGDDVGSLFSNIFEKFNIRDSQEMLETIDALANQGKMGAFELRDLATQGERIISAYAAMGRTGKEAAIEMGTMMQLGRKGTGSTEQAATAFEALVRNLTDNRIIKKLRSIGVTVKDSSGNFRAIPDIVQDIIVRTKGNTTKLGAIFDEFARRAVNPIAIAYQQALREGKSAKEAFEQLQNLMSVDTSGQSIIGDSERMAQTFEASVNSLKDALRYFANTNLAEPIAKLAQAINGIDGAQVQKYLDMGLKAAKYLAIAWGANKLIRGTVDLHYEHKKPNSDGKMVYYTDINFTLQVFDITTGALDGSESYKYSELSLSSYADSFNSVIRKVTKDMTQFCNKFFKMESYILELGEADKGGNIKDLWISGGTEVGISNGTIFKVLSEKKIGPKVTRVAIGEVIAKEVLEGMTRCEIKNKKEGEVIKTKFNDGEKLYIELDRKRGDGAKEIGRLFGF